MDDSESAALRVPERWIAPPRTISPEARAFLSQRLPVFQSEMPALEDKEGWRVHAAAENERLVGYSARNAERFPAETVTHRLSACPVYEVAPKTLTRANDDRAILFIHGGGFIMGGGQAAIYGAMPLASFAGMRTYSVDYRMPPDHPFPTPVEDAVEAYRWLLEKYRSERIAVYGPSAGANIATAMVLKARELGLPLPGACALHSPASDCTESGDSFETNAFIDIVLQKRVPELMALYAGGHDMTDPLLSPLFADYSAGFPPTLLTTGTRDLLLSSTVLLHRAMRRGGIRAELHVWEAMTHAPFPDAPETRELLEEKVRFLLLNTGG